MKIELTKEEAQELCKAIMLAAQHPEAMEINWMIMDRILKKLDRDF